MKPIVTTPRLFLREFELSDAEAMYRLNADPEVLRFTGDMPFVSVETARSFLKNYDHYQKYGFGRWAVVLQSDKKFIGWCGLKHNEEGLIDLGFRFFRSEWNKGYATEAAKACLDYGFKHLGLQEIIGRSDIRNKASIRVLEKIGMQFWKYATVPGIHDAVYYRSLRG